MKERLLKPEGNTEDRGVHFFFRFRCFLGRANPGMLMKLGFSD